MGRSRVRGSMGKKTPFENKTVEQVRQFWDRRPCNIRHSPSEMGTKQYFDEVEARKYMVEQHIPRFAGFDRWRDKKVLEIGCGIGTDTMMFARNGAKVTAVELSERSLEIARQRAEVLELDDRISFYSGDAERLADFVPTDSYDLVYSFGVIHHTPHPERVLDQIRGYVKPGGIVKLMVYNRRSYKVIWIALKYGKGRFWRLPELVAENSEAATGSPVTFTYSRKEITDLLRRHGFRVEEIWVDHIFPYGIPDYVEYRYKKVWWFRYLPAPLFRWLERHFGWHLCLTARVLP